MTSDIVEIQQLLHRYCHAVDRGTVDDVMEVFHRDAVLLPRYQSDEAFKGGEAVRGWYERYFETARKGTRVLRHKISAPLIELDGRRATSVCYLDADFVSTDGEAGMSKGRYEDKLINDGGRWWIAERAIIVEGNYPLPKPGQ